MLEIITRYYGVDLVATVITLIAIHMLGSKKKQGFTLAFIGNILWLAVGVLSQSVGLIIANIALGVLNVRGYYLWK